MKTRIAASILCTAALAFGAVGCGGDDEEAAPGNDFAEQPEAQQESQKDVARLVADFVKSARTADADSLCSLFVPDDVNETFGSAKGCSELFTPLLKKSKVENVLEISDLQFDGDQATASFSNGSAAELEQIDGKWYLEIPDEVADQVKNFKGE